MAENIAVAARIRPLNEREKFRNAKNIVKVSGETTTVEDPNNEGVFKDFEFNYTYDKNTDQAQIFQDIGTGIVDKSLKGYNCSVFAYGQTGSGKSYTLSGYGEMEGLCPRLGLCPRILDKLYDELEKRQTDECSFIITVSVLEVYNESIYDLLVEKRGRPLRVRESPKGVYVEGLRREIAKNLSSAKALLESSVRNRTVASTLMNQTSSRSHTVIGISIDQHNKELNVNLSSRIQIVDLAGSERASSTGATGDRLKEGASINRSLTVLGNVFNALYKKSQGGAGRVIVPYRDSVLTRLLKESLGGNSYTVMFATISPADINYDETLSTLRYAQRVKGITNKPTLNKNPVDKLIDDLKLENKRLLEELRTTEGSFLGEKEVTAEESESIVGSSDEKSQELEKDDLQSFSQEEKAIDVEPKKVLEGVPYLTNLHEDSALSGQILHYIENGSSITIGNPRQSTADSPEVKLLRARIAETHAMLKNENGVVKVIPFGGPVYINGKMVPVEEMQLEHNDRIMFGKSYDSIYVFKDPTNESQANTGTVNINYDYAKREIARYADAEIYISSEDIFLKELIVRLEQTVDEANAIAKELNRTVTYDIILISALSLDEVKDMCHIFILCRHTINDTTREYLWTEDDFYDRFAMMTTEYFHMGQQKDSDGAESEKEENAEDPFVQPTEAPTLIGVVFIPLTSLCSMTKTEDKFSVSSARTNGYLDIGVCPCTKYGEEVDEFIDPTNLLGRELNFKIKITEAKELPAQFGQTWCQYRFNMDPEDVETKSIIGKNPHYDFCKRYKQTNVTQNFIEYLDRNQLIIRVYGKESIDEEKESLKTKIQDLRERKKAKHEKLSEKKKEIKELKAVIEEKDKLLRMIAEKARDSNDLLAIEISELLKDKI